MEKKIAVLITILVIIILISVAALIVFMPELNGTYARLQRTGEVSFDLVLSDNADFEGRILSVINQFADIYADNGIVNPFVTAADMKLIQFDAVTDENLHVKNLDLVVRFESDGSYYTQTLKISGGTCKIMLRKAGDMPQDAPDYKDFIKTVSGIDYSEFIVITGEWALSFAGFDQLANSKNYAAQAVVLGEDGKPFPSGTPASIYDDYTVVSLNHEDEMATQVVKYRFYIK